MPLSHGAQLIDQEAQVLPLVERLLRAPRIAIDTEFHAEHRYRPELMLVQVAELDGTVWLLDPRAVDLRPLARVVARVPMVLHGGTQDIQLLQRATGAVPAHVLDTQRAAAFLGLGYPTRLGAITHRMLGLPMDKAAGLTDWSTRPLTERQMQYAAADATILLPLAQALEEELSASGRLEWARAASTEGVAEALDDPGDVDIWLAWDIAGQLDETERRTMSALFHWRESAGRNQDQPPRQILSDALGLDLARRRPASMADLSENRRIPQGLIKRHGAAVLAVIRAAAESKAPAPEAPGPETALLLEALHVWAGALERETGIARTLSLPRPVALRVARHGSTGLQGWRQEALGARLDAFLTGQACLLVDSEKVHCRLIGT